MGSNLPKNIRYTEDHAGISSFNRLFGRCNRKCCSCAVRTREDPSARPQQCWEVQRPSGLCCADCPQRRHTWHVQWHGSHVLAVCDSAHLLAPSILIDILRICRHVTWNGGYFACIFSVRAALPKANVNQCFTCIGQTRLAFTDGRSRCRLKVPNCGITCYRRPSPPKWQHLHTDCDVIHSGSIGGFVGTVMNTPCKLSLCLLTMMPIQAHPCNQ